MAWVTNRCCDDEPMDSAWKHSALPRPAPAPFPASGPRQAGSDEASDRALDVRLESSPTSDLERPSAIALPLLVQLRWLAVLGQAALLVLGLAAGASLPYALLWAIVGLTLASNLALRWVGERARVDHLLPLVLTADTLLLTCLLALSGGPHNPFTALYVVHVALAAVAMSPRGTAWIAALSGICYAAMFELHVPQPLWHGGVHAPGHISAHLVGMWLALAVVAAVIAYFIGRLAQQLASARALAARNDRLASLTTLAAGAAHELGSPLGTIAVAATEITRSSAGATRDDAQLIRAEVERCRAILDRMSGAAASAQRAPEHRALEATLSELLAELGTASARVAIEWSDDLRTCVVAHEAVHQALKSLVLNALEASADVVAVRVSRHGRELVFRVVDRGCGVPAEILARAGEPFCTTKEPGKGTGLGLYVVRLIAERMGGHVRLRSAPGRGTEALFSIPLPDEAGAAASTAGVGR